MMRSLLIASLFCFLWACKTDKEQANERKLDENTTIEKPTPPKYNVPDPGEIFTAEEIERALGLQENTMYDIKNNGNANDRTRSAFYRVADPELGNAAVLLQISGNPVKDDYPNWDLDFIDNKKLDGERNVKRPGEVYQYEDFPYGEEGAYNIEQRRFYWRTKDRHIYMMAFNVTKSDEEILSAAKKLAEIAVDKVN